MSKQYATLGHILRTSFGAKFLADFQNWESCIADYERDSGTILPDSKISILQIETSGQAQQHFRLNSSRYTSYKEIRNLLVDYYRATPAFAKGSNQTQSSYRGPAPMDVDAVWRTKGKAKGKSKGKGKKGFGKTGTSKGKKGLTAMMEEEADVNYFGGYTGKRKERKVWIQRKRKGERKRNRKRKDSSLVQEMRKDRAHNRPLLCNHQLQRYDCR